MVRPSINATLNESALKLTVDTRSSARGKLGMSLLQLDEQILCRGYFSQ
jgi:hypothetical protein